MMRILLAYPSYPDTFWSFKHILKYISKKAAYPPLGLLTVAAMLPEEWEKKLVDLNIKDLADEQIDWADMIFVSAMIVQKESAKEVIKRCKAKGKTVVVGGPAFTTQPETFPEADHYILNEAEVTLPPFLKDLEEGKAKKTYSSMERPDITKTPTPLWSLIKFKDYATMMVQYSRGCPFNCEFCDIVIMNGRIPRTKNPDQIINELQTLYNLGWKESVFIVDDNFIGNKRRVKELLPRIIEWQRKHKYPFKLLTEASVNLADDEELMKMMSAANFYKVFLGIETPNTDGLHECGKVQNTTRDLANAVKTIQHHGMQVMGGFIVGFDTDNEGIFEAQKQFIQKVGIVTAMVGVLTALPQTRLWHRLKSEGRLIGETTGGNTDGKLNFIPKMGKDKLTDGYKRLLTALYSRKLYYKRINTFLKNYKPTARGRLNLKDIKAFLKSSLRIGVFSTSNLQYWRVVIKTFFTKRKALPEVVELAICRHHFKKITKKIARA
jgi:radical SAM superfamily enzyme YgiQ (UPF0313 family)